MKVKSKFWLSIGAIFVFGAMTSNVVWLQYVDSVDQFYQSELNAQRAEIASRIDEVLERLSALPPDFNVIEAKRKLEEVKNER